MNQVKYFFFAIECLLIVASFFMSIRLLLVKSKIKSFFLYSFVSFIVMSLLCLHTFKIFNLKYANLINNFSLVFNFSFLAYFITSNFHSVKKKKLFRLFSLFFSCFILFLLFNESHTKQTAIFGVNHFGLLVVSMVYLFDIAENEYVIQLTKAPEFWIVIGVVICSSLNLPTLTLHKIIFTKKSLTPAKDLLINIIPMIAYSIQYCFFIVAFLMPKK